MLSQSSISSKGRAAGWARKFLGGARREQPCRPGREENAGDVPRPRNPGDVPEPTPPRPMSAPPA